VNRKKKKKKKKQQQQQTPKFGEESCVLPYRDAKSKNRPQF
jgi:hypothetical protein